MVATSAERVNRGDLKEAEEMLDALLRDDIDPVDAQKAQDVLKQIRERLRRKR